MSLIDTKFQVDESKCVGCGLCQLACPSMLIEMNEHKKPSLKPVISMDWYGCWGCQHCLTVCPNGAISVLGKKPENSLSVPDYMETEQVMNTLIANRHSCRRYQNRAVDSAVIEDMLCRLGNAPNGGNKQQVEFTLIDDMEQMNEFRNLAYKEMERLAENGVYPEGFDKKTYEDMKRWEQSVRPEKKKLRSKKVL